MNTKTTFAKGQLKTLVERIERLEEEKKTIAADIKEVYAEAKGNGFETKILRRVISIRKKDRHEREEERDTHRERDRCLEVLADERVAPSAQAERTGGDERAEAAAERAEDVAAEADGRGDEDEETGEELEGVGDRAENESGYEAGCRREQVRDEARSDSGWICAYERAEPPHEAGKARHW